MPAIEVIDHTPAENDTGPEDDRTHGLLPHGFIACRGIHVVQAIKRQLGYTVRALTGNLALDAEAISCLECRAVLGL